MKSYLNEQLKEALKRAGLSAPDADIQFEKPKLAEHGDVATNIAMVLAKPARRNPRELAGIIRDALLPILDERKIAAVDIAGPGFINFRYAETYIYDMLEDIIRKGSAYGRSETHRGKKINVEWVSANPTGPLHAGHGRQVCLGATLCVLLEWSGWDVTREYYFNNAGNQMQNLAITVRARYLEQCGETPNPEDLHYAGEYVSEIGREVFAEFGIEKKEADIDFFRLRGERWCFASITRTLAVLGVRHDVFFNEDSLYRDGKIADVLHLLKSQDLAYEHDGATWLRTTAFGADKDRVIVKGTGEPTYRLPDIAYHREKLLRGYDRIIDIFGADHIATIPDVLSGVKALGLPVDHVDVIIHQMVSFVNDGEAVRMSKRSGNVYYLDDLIEDVGQDAVRYFFVMRGANAHLEFDVKLAQEQSENNPVYYLQYAHARIASILRFAESQGLETGVGAELSLLRHPAEHVLIKTLLGFPEIVALCASTYEAQHLCTYLNILATEFHRFYHECRVVTEDVALSRSRLALCRATKQVLTNGCTLLGITAPEKM
jgi:arginyl-tRNA synthetase